MWLKITPLLLSTVLVCLPLYGLAKPLRLANQGDATSMDPHSLQESFQLSFLGNIYEPLVTRGRNFELEPCLATSWKAVNGTTWRFELRQGVKFQDGSPFTADDVLFNLERTRAESADTKLYVSQIKEIRKLNAHSIEIVTLSPYPLLPSILTGWLQMSRSWAEQHEAQIPLNSKSGKTNYATMHANGTGPFVLKTRQPGVRTILANNPGWWGRAEHNLTEVVFTPIGNAATRMAALVSGEIDVMEPVPLQDVERIKADPALRVVQGPELRTLFLGLDMFRDELLFSNIKGKNPLKDRRVRQALYQAIDIEAIRLKIMRGAALPAGVLLAPGVHGYEASFDQRLAYDQGAAKQLLSQAGYPAGFELGLRCPNDRYVNDADICQAVAAMWTRVGVKTQLTTETKTLYLPKVLKSEVSAYLLGWQPAGNDTHNTLWTVLNTQTATGQGQFNVGRYSNPKLDELTQRMGVEVDTDKRQALVREAWGLVAQDMPVLPLHSQMLAWGVRRNIDLHLQPDNNSPLRYITGR